MIKCDISDTSPCEGHGAQKAEILAMIIALKKEKVLVGIIYLDAKLNKLIRHNNKIARPPQSKHNDWS